MITRLLNARIEGLGGLVVRQRGSHRLYRAVAADGSEYTTVVPQHAGDIKVGTLRKIERDLEPAFGKGWLKR